MRPRIPEREKRKIVVKLLLNKEEKLLLDSIVKRGRYACTSDYMRLRLFDQSRRKVITLDDEAKAELQRLDYELNKIGVNLNQLSKRVHSFAGYQIGDEDRKLLRDAFDMMRECLGVLGKYLY